MARTTPLVERAILVDPVGAAPPIAVGTPAWYAWLAHATSFAYRDAAGHFTARKQRAGGADGYWRAYRKRAGKLSSAYLGKSAALTLARLQHAAARLADVVAHQPHDPAALLPDAIAPPPVTHRFTQVPVPLTPLLGREAEVAAVVTALQRPTVRLLTLTGPGGVGKTHLALVVAAHLATTGVDGVWWVDLAALSDPSLVPQRIAAALGIREQPGHALADTLAGGLRSRQVLLALDNCEHLLPACASLADHLLRACPQLRILATSRALLGIAGETAWPVPGLAVPDPFTDPPVEELARYGAIELFVARATALQPAFTLSAHTAPAVVQICRRLDGLPLAIELAAARLNVLTAPQIAARLDDRFTLLTSGRRVAPARQQTLKATVDWSYDLLAPAEQAVFRRLSVFVGGWTLAAAAAVCVDAQQGQDDVLDVLAQLVTMSLIELQPHGDEPRYHMLETLRAYGGDRLRDTGETARIRRRHAAFFLALVAAAQPAVDDLAGRENLPPASLHRLEAEHDNVRAALDWCLMAERDADVLAGLQAAAGLLRFWEMRMDFHEGAMRLEAFLQHPAAAPRTLARANAAYAAGRLAHERGAYASARAHYEEGLAIFREVQDERGIAMSLSALDPRRKQTEDAAAARALTEDSLARYRALGDATGIAVSLRNLSQIAWSRGDFDRATALGEDSLARFGELHDSEGMSEVCSTLALVALFQGDAARAAGLMEHGLSLARDSEDQRAVIYMSIGHGLVLLAQGDADRAQGVLEASLARTREAGIPHATGWALNLLGAVAILQGDGATATARLTESLPLYRQDGDRWGMAECLERLAAVACAQGRRERSHPHMVRAARLIGSAEALRSATGHPMAPFERDPYEHAVAATQAALGAECFELERARGGGLSLDEAVAYALAEPRSCDETAPASGAQAPRQARTLSVGGLTLREREVAALVALGKSNRVIAGELVVSVRAVEAHMTRILAKLDFTSRAQIAVWAVEIGLAQVSHPLNT